jgi:AraC-like DNA-binding protein
MSSTTYPAEHGDNKAFEGELRSVLHSHDDVRVARDDETAVCFQKYVSNSISVIAASADRPMKAANGPSSTTDVYVLCLRQGRLRIAHSGGKLVLNAGQFIVFPGHHALEVTHEQPYALLGLRFRGQALARWLPDWNFAEFLPLSVDGAEGKLAFDMAAGLLHTGRHLQEVNASWVGDAVVRLLAHSLSSKSLGDLGPSHGLAEYHRRRVKQFCRSHLASEHLTVDAVASAMGLSKPHLHRLFKDEPLTLKAWIQAQRLEAAKLEIEADVLGMRTLTSIAFSNGFTDFAHFSHAFKCRYGYPPRALRALQTTSGDTHTSSP